MPTALERQGDFSQTLVPTGKMIKTRRKTSFRTINTGDRIKSNGQKLLSVFPCQ